jgi:hypothetical protein
MKCVHGLPVSTCRISQLHWRSCKRCGVLFLGRMTTDYCRACGKHPERKLRRA